MPPQPAGHLQLTSRTTAGESRYDHETGFAELARQPSGKSAGSKKKIWRRLPRWVA
jgi:hypothetical protein